MRMVYAYGKIKDACFSSDTSDWVLLAPKIGPQGQFWMKPLMLNAVSQEELKDIVKLLTGLLL